MSARVKVELTEEQAATLLMALPGAPSGEETVRVNCLPLASGIGGKRKA